MLVIVVLVFFGCGFVIVVWGGVVLLVGVVASRSPADFPDAVLDVSEVIIGVVVSWVAGGDDCLMWGV